MSNTRYVRILPSAVESKYRGWGEDSVGLVYMILGEEHGFLRLAYAPNRIENKHIKEVYVYDEPRELPTAKPMKVRVVKANSNRSWYSNRIGKEFDVLAEEGDYFKVKWHKEGGTTYYIRKRDCEIVTEPEPDRIAELEARVKALEEKQREVSAVSVYDAEVLKNLPKTELTYTGQQPAPQAESNLDKAKRLYYKGVKFKCALLGGEFVSSGEIRESKAKDGNIVCVINGEPMFLFLDGQWAEIVQDEPAQKIDLIKEYLEPTGITITELMDRNAFASLCQLLDAYLLESVRNSR